MNRRNFFKRVMQAAAVVAIAPQIAFRSTPKIDIQEVYQWMPKMHPYQIEVFCSPDVAKTFRRAVKYYYGKELNLT